MMKNFWLIIITITLFSCKSNKATVNYEELGYTKATVIKYEVEACGYILQLDNESKLMPDKLDDSFKKDKLSVWIKYQIPKRQEMSTCMAGKQAVILEIKKR